MDDLNAVPSPRRYKWPWFVLAAVIVFLVLAVVWVSVAVRQTRERNAWNPLPGQATTNAPVRQ